MDLKSVKKELYIVFGIYIIALFFRFIGAMVYKFQIASLTLLDYLIVATILGSSAMIPSSFGKMIFVKNQKVSYLLTSMVFSAILILLVNFFGEGWLETTFICSVGWGWGCGYGAVISGIFTLLLMIPVSLVSLTGLIQKKLSQTKV